ncbi:MAG: nickel-dependent hydrogenase large subunit, partial [Eggerthella lenta]
EVKTVEMNVVEPARLFESMVRGRRFEEIPYISSRICGICSSSHVVTDLKAIERVFGVEVTDRTRALRELLVYGSYLQNHASHLFVFAAPDFLGMPSVFPLAQTDPELFEQALGLKALGNELCTKVEVAASIAPWWGRCPAGDIWSWQTRWMRRWTSP